MQHALIVVAFLVVIQKMEIPNRAIFALFCIIVDTAIAIMFLV